MALSAYLCAESLINTILMKFFTRIAMVCLVVGLSLGLQAQKFGYVHSGQLLEMHPKLAEANAELEAFQKTESASFDERVKAFDAKYQKFAKDYEGGLLSQVEAAKMQETLGAEQQELAQLEQQTQFKIAQKREQLVQPLLQDLDTAIKEVGKEGGYVFIFDTNGGGNILYAQEQDDVTDLVKAKLGWN